MKVRIVLFFTVLIFGIEALSCWGYHSFRQRHGLGQKGVWETIYLTRLFVPRSSLGNADAEQDPTFNPDSHFDLNWYKLFLFDGLLGWRFRPGAFIWDNGKIPIQTDSQGFIPTEDDPAKIYSKKKPQGVFRIIFSGGSTVLGYGLDYHDSLPARVLRILRSKFPNRTFEVIDAGVLRYDSWLSFLQLESELRSYEPDLLVYYGGGIDFTDFYFKNLYYQDGFYDARNAYNDRAANELGFGLYAFSRQLAGSFDQFMSGFATYSLAEALLRRPETRQTQPIIPEVAARYGENLAQIIDAGLRNRFRVAVFLEPLLAVGKSSRAELESGIRGYLAPTFDEGYTANVNLFYKDAREEQARLARRYSSERTSVCIEDASQALDGGAGNLYQDPTHLNAEGTERMSEEVARRLEDCGVLR